MPAKKTAAKKAVPKLTSAKAKEAIAKAPVGSEAEGRCMKDKEQVTFVVEGHDVWSNGMVVALGKCTCGTKVQRILGKA